jgi:hypothetical protein
MSTPDQNTCKDGSSPSFSDLWERRDQDVAGVETSSLEAHDDDMLVTSISIPAANTFSFRGGTVSGRYNMN